MNYVNNDQKPGAIRQMLSLFWNIITWVRVAIFNIIFLLVILGIFIALGSSPKLILPDEFALRLAPTGMLVDQRSYVDPMSMLLSDENFEESETVVREVVDAINFAAEDKRVTTLVLELDALLGGGVSKLQEIGQALETFKATGKKIIAFGDNYTQEQYYLASYADQIYLNDMGSVLLTGYGSYRTYFKGAIDKLEINFHVFRSGKYKDAVEPFLRTDMSDESKEHNAQWLNELWSQYTQHIETARELPANSLNNFINTMDVKMAEVDGDSARLALTNGLVDGIMNYHDVQQLLIGQLGKSAEGNFYQGVSHNVYLNDALAKQPSHADKIGLLVASGSIFDGDQPAGNIGSYNFSEMLQRIREEKTIKALVLRIDSGGGSAFASEVIRSEIQATRDAGIPVYISMGSVAASGGYWMAAGGDEIWATSTTITGSIGVFGAFPTVENTLANAGLTSDGVGTTELAGALRLDRPLSPQASSIIQQNVDHIYQRFIQLVADARTTDVEKINTIAQGRVWAGTTAKELGLVDQLGTLNDVIAAAAENVGLEDYSVELIAPELSPTEMFLRELANTSASSLTPKIFMQKFTALELQQSLTPLLKPLALLTKMNDPKAIYAICSECVAP